MSQFIDLTNVWIWPASGSWFWAKPERVEEKGEIAIRPDSVLIVAEHKVGDETVTRIDIHTQGRWNGTARIYVRETYEEVRAMIDSRLT